MLNLSIINSKATVKQNSSTAKSSAQLSTYNSLLINKTMNYNDVFDVVCDYTLQPSKQLDTWFKTPELYNEFTSEIPTIKTVEQMNAFKTKHILFFDAMNKKTFDLFFNAKHSRVITKHKSFGNDVTLKTVFNVNGEIDKVLSTISLKTK